MYVALICRRQLLAAALELARKSGAHVFNALELGELTPELLEGLGFGEGDGKTHVSVERSDGALEEWRRDLSPKRVSWLPLV